MVNAIIGRINLVGIGKTMRDHSNTKNMMIKKSLSGFTLLIISNLYADQANVIPAINAPISIEKPKK
jgi:hypothetical protein